MFTPELGVIPYKIRSEEGKDGGVIFFISRGRKYNLNI
jgi:hypothetical protein